MTETASGGLKKHSPFVQVLLRKSGEALDLGGKALIGLSGLGHILDQRDLARLDWSWFTSEVLIGGVALLLGIHLQAKAEETLP